MPQNIMLQCFWILYLPVPSCGSLSLLQWCPSYSGAPPTVVPPWFVSGRCSDACLPAQCLMTSCFSVPGFYISLLLLHGAVSLLLAEGAKFQEWTFKNQMLGQIIIHLIKGIDFYEMYAGSWPCHLIQHGVV